MRHRSGQLRECVVGCEFKLVAAPHDPICQIGNDKVVVRQMPTYSGRLALRRPSAVRSASAWLAISLAYSEIDCLRRDRVTKPVTAIC